MGVGEQDRVDGVQPCGLVGEVAGDINEDPDVTLQQR